MYRILFAGMYYHFLKVEGVKELLIKPYYANVAVYAMTVSHSIFVFGVALLFFLDKMRSISWGGFVMGALFVFYLTFHYLYLHKAKYKNIVGAYYHSAAKYRTRSLTYHILLMLVFLSVGINMIFNLD